MAVKRNDMDTKKSKFILYQDSDGSHKLHLFYPSFLLVFILTLNKINHDFGARNFLENITYLPNEPVTSTVLIFIAFFLLLGIIEIRRKQRKKATGICDLICSRDFVMSDHY